MASSTRPAANSLAGESSAAPSLDASISISISIRKQAVLWLIWEPDIGLMDHPHRQGVAQRFGIQRSQRHQSIVRESAGYLNLGQVRDRSLHIPPAQFVILDLVNVSPTVFLMHGFPR